jgi:tetratricopeptide (TPR) repeat protein
MSIKKGHKSAAPRTVPAPRLAARSRRWWFVPLAVLAVPVCVLLLTEGVLRVMGFGHPTTFFVRQEIGGKTVLVENTWFGHRFFPSSLARSPSPVVMTAEKPPGTFRIFLFGESAALGDPRPAFGMGRYLQALLEARAPGLKTEVVCVAMTAINSHAILPLAQECARYQGDLWVIYAGNNEMSGPFGANTAWGTQAPPLWLARMVLQAQRTRIGQAVVRLREKLSSADSPAQAWGGLKMFREHQLNPADQRKGRIYYNFQRNLEDIVGTGIRARVPMVLCSVASNLRDFPPFASLPAEPTDPSVRPEWEQALKLAQSQVQAQNWVAALTNLQAAIRLNPDAAEPHFLFGLCALAQNSYDLARESLIKARDLDALPFRADSRINAIIHEVAQRHQAQHVSFVDATTVLSSTPPVGIPGTDCFYEHVHLNFDGNYRIALALADRVLPVMPASANVRPESSWASSEACAQRLALTDWNRLTVYEEIGRRLADAPYTNQFNHAQRMAGLMREYGRIRGRCQPAAAAAARDRYESSVRLYPDDHWLHHNYAEFLKAVGELALATAEMEKVRDLTPQHYAVYLHVGRLYGAQKKFDAATLSFEQALRLRPDLAEPYGDLGQVAAAQGQYRQALQYYQTASKGRPPEASGLLREAEAWIGLENRDEAIRCLREAVQLRPAYWEAHNLLGVQLSLAGKLSEAQGTFETVVLLRPKDVAGRLNLGLVMAQQERRQEALACFQEVLRLDPQNEKALQMIDALQTPKPVPPEP